MNIVAKYTKIIRQENIYTELFMGLLPFKVRYIYIVHYFTAKDFLILQAMFLNIGIKKIV